MLAFHLPTTVDKEPKLFAFKVIHLFPLFYLKISLSGNFATEPYIVMSNVFLVLAYNIHYELSVLWLALFE